MVKALNAAMAALLLILGGAGVAGAAEYPPTDGAMQGFVLVKERTPAPAEPFEDGAGATLSLADFGGQVLLVNFWATWCPPCVHEMPSLDRLQAELGGEDFQVLAISQDRGGARVAEPFLRERLELDNLALYLDPQFRVWKAFQAGGLPATYAIDRQGRIVGVLRGAAEWDSDDAKALVRHLIEE